MNLIECKEKIQLPLRQSTLCFLTRDDEILLAIKKRGFGVGKWNGVGGKPNVDEKIGDAATREAKEEIGVTLTDLEACAVIDFLFPHNPDWNQQVVVYLSKNWDGEPAETEEMKPTWFKQSEIPFSDMWPDDLYWLPKVLEGDKIKAEFMFGENDTIVDFNIDKIDSLNF